jgi:hypothetical protein
MEMSKKFLEKICVYARLLIFFTKKNNFSVAKKFPFDKVVMIQIYMLTAAFCQKSFFEKYACKTFHQKRRIIFPLQKSCHDSPLIASCMHNLLNLKKYFLKSAVVQIEEKMFFLKMLEKWLLPY